MTPTLQRLTIRGRALAQRLLPQSAQGCLKVCDD
jgi:hypothetical protein